MAHKISWLVEKRVILIVFDGDVDKYEVTQLNEELEHFRAEGQKPIHIISDNRRIGTAKLTLRNIFIDFSSMKKSGWGLVIMIGANHALRFFAEVFATQFGIKIRMMASQEEALEMLNKLDLSLHGENRQP